MVFETACEADRDAVRTLWTEAFTDDTPEDVDAFLERWFACDAVLLVRDGNTVASMLFLLPQPLCIGERVLTAGYIYAGATAVSYRGQGLYRRLLMFASRYAEQRGMAALFLHPADERLADSYVRMGFTVPMTCAPTMEVEQTGDRTLLSAAEYRTARKRALADEAAYIDWTADALEYALTWCRAVRAGESVALLGERNGQPFAWECFGALPLPASGGRSPGTAETVGRMKWLDESYDSCSLNVYMGYGWE